MGRDCENQGPPERGDDPLALSSRCEEYMGEPNDFFEADTLYIASR
jgi:hypothetical protein